MEEVATLFSIKISPLFIGVVLVIITALAIGIYMKKRNSEQS